HAWIEHRTAGQRTLLEPDSQPDLAEAETAAPSGGSPPDRFEDLKGSFENSRFAPLTPLYAERAFLLRVAGATIAGRIDAIYGTADGAWEIVDYKSGKEYDPDDPASWF